ncbi:predicted protein [Histoplasma capsulatum var. duboisii H88]|uniref:Predicted protein n=1 Tax=Ajellomyces capsulatus (strain H88) TaxID=544711 RepID=F0UDY5_AJEC8|nr:predicted protein [Histoplasma capsulatum var. duboisii H88]
MPDTAQFGAFSNLDVCSSCWQSFGTVLEFVVDSRACVCEGIGVKRPPNQRAFGFPVDRVISIILNQSGQFILSLAVEQFSSSSTSFSRSWGFVSPFQHQLSNAAGIAEGQAVLCPLKLHP